MLRHPAAAVQTPPTRGARPGTPRCATHGATLRQPFRIMVLNGFADGTLRLPRPIVGSGLAEAVLWGLDLEQVVLGEESVEACLVDR